MADGASRATPRSLPNLVSGERPAVGRHASVDELDYDDVGPTTIELPSDDRFDDAAPLEASFDPPVPGDVVGERYRLDRVIGRGAAGIVYEATHLVIDKRVALKCLYPHVARSRDAVARFFREAQIAAGVEHPNVVTIFDGGRDGDLNFLVMELVDGASLGAHLERGLAPVAETVQLFLRITHGVAAVHDAGVVHRDLKPDNVLLSGPERSPKVLDFGISKLTAPDSSKLTSLGAVMGTPYYMAPEQVTDTRNVDARADVYSLGVMLYEALTGRLPYEGQSVLELYRHATEGRCVPAHQLRPDVPPSLSAVVAKALCPERDARFHDVRAMREALAAVPFDGSDAGLDFDDRSEPWMLVARDARPDDEPIETAPTRIGPAPTSSGARPVVTRESAARVVAVPAPPFYVWALLALVASGAGAAVTSVLWLLSG